MTGSVSLWVVAVGIQARTKGSSVSEIKYVFPKHQCHSRYLPLSVSRQYPIGFTVVGETTSAPACQRCHIMVAIASAP